MVGACNNIANRGGPHIDDKVGDWTADRYFSKEKSRRRDGLAKAEKKVRKECGCK